LARLYASDIRRLSNLGIRLNQRFEGIFEVVKDQEAAAETWNDRMRERARAEESTSSSSGSPNAGDPS
ncbi:hypothetical protein Pmar_PMAR014365, partial [Perkinsus marinus ATCC 50983]